MLSIRLEFSPASDAEFFAALPASPAVFLLRGDDANSEPYITKTASLRRRLLRLLGPADSASKRLNLRERVRNIEYSPTASDFESGFLLYKVLRETFPQSYADRLRLRPAPLIKLILDNAYPRVTVTSRISSIRAGNAYFGPFPTRTAAEKFANDALDFFGMRRCTDDLAPDPTFPGCVYSEMKMCLAPCFKGCSDERYAEEVARVRAFLESGGRTLTHELSAERDRASESLDFENAAALHSKIEKLRGVCQQLPEIVRAIDRLDGVLIQPSSETDCVRLFKIVAGRIADPVDLKLGARQALAENVAPQPGRSRIPQSMESRIAEALASAPAPLAQSAQEWMEHLAMLKRWYYRTSKVGEIFLADEKGDLPMRRVVRGVSRVFKGEKPQADLSESARDYWINRGREAQLDS
ncbi:MAG TPA: UvrB/UvrC motif-containing protein [Clostridia bacterium]|nr:UvrB/UvrC motif-containing protein [Clostridia bacterium]